MSFLVNNNKIKYSTYPSKIKGISVNELKTSAVVQNRSQVVKRVPQSLRGITPDNSRKVPCSTLHEL